MPHCQNVCLRDHGLTGLVMTLPFDLWPRKPFQQWPLTCGKFYWNPCTKYRDTVLHETDVNRWTDGWLSDPKT